MYFAPDFVRMYGAPYSIKSEKINLKQRNIFIFITIVW